MIGETSSFFHVMIWLLITYVNHMGSSKPNVSQDFTHRRSLGGKRGGGKGVSTGKASFQETSLGLRWPRRESEAVKYIFIMSWPVNLSLNKALFMGG